MVLITRINGDRLQRSNGREQIPTLNEKEVVMKQRAIWMVPIGTLLVAAITVSLLLVPGVMAESGKAAVSVNINTADTGELATLPGIGNSKAAAIVSYRSEQGPFATVDDLTKVPGIGSSILEKIRDLIRTR
jgi:competence protein ComEA